MRGTANDQDRVTKSRSGPTTYDGLSGVTTLTAYNGSSPSTQVTEYKYASTVDASWPTLVKYPDGNTTIGMGEDNVQLANHTDGTLDTRKDQRGTTLLFAYDELRRPQAMQVTADGTAETTVQSITRDYDDIGRGTIFEKNARTKVWILGHDFGYKVRMYSYRNPTARRPADNPNQPPRAGVRFARIVLV